jgi:hypothetical protein
MAIFPAGNALGIEWGMQILLPQQLRHLHQHEQ